jgi:hypothetical protein
MSNYQLLQEEVMQNVVLNVQEHGYDNPIYTEGILDDTKYLYDNFIRIRKLFADYGYSFRKAFLQELVNQNLATKVSLKTKAFIEAFNNFYSVEYLSEIGLSVRDCINNKWPINFCREKARQHTYSLEYILMARFLFGSFENFINEAEKRSKLSLNIVSNNVIKSNKLIDSTTLDSFRNRWLTVIKQNPGIGRIAVRKTDEATYRWLRANDLAWLKEHLPEKLPKQQPSNYVDWCERDKALSEQVSSVVETIKISDGKPQKITKLSICQALGCKAMFLNYQNKLPLTNIEIEKAVETLDQFRLRQCKWIIDILQEQGIQPTAEEVFLILKPTKNRSQWKESIVAILMGS